MSGRLLQLNFRFGVSAADYEGPEKKKKKKKSGRSGSSTKRRVKQEGSTCSTMRNP